MYLLENQTEDTSDSAVGVEVTMYSFTDRVFVCDGTFDGCTVTIEVKGKDGWVSAGDDAKFTEGGGCVVTLRGGMYIRGAVSSAGASTDVSLEMKEQ